MADPAARAPHGASPTRIAAEYLLLSGRAALAPDTAAVGRSVRSPLDDLDHEERIALRHAIDAELAARAARDAPDTMAPS
jgi:hypothetical protein